ncbi:hypothetical protein G6L30_07915 [Agrobacterium rhizogenes]|nr:hypothetical protein [Rhizobium rhizogenes]
MSDIPDDIKAAAKQCGDEWINESGWHGNLDDYIERALFAERQRSDSLKALCDEMAKALEPFAECCQYIEDTDDDEEWAKFRLIVSDYRRAKAALSKAKEQDNG